MSDRKAANALVQHFRSGGLVQYVVTSEGPVQATPVHPRWRPALVESTREAGATERTREGEVVTYRPVPSFVTKRAKPKRARALYDGHVIGSTDGGSSGSTVLLYVRSGRAILVLTSLLDGFGKREMHDVFRMAFREIPVIDAVDGGDDATGLLVLRRVVKAKKTANLRLKAYQVVGEDGTLYYEVASGWLETLPVFPWGSSFSDLLSVQRAPVVASASVESLQSLVPFVSTDAGRSALQVLHIDGEGAAAATDGHTAAFVQTTAASGLELSISPTVVNLAALTAQAQVEVRGIPASEGFAGAGERYKRAPATAVTVGPWTFLSRIPQNGVVDQVKKLLRKSQSKTDPPFERAEQRAFVDRAAQAYSWAGSRGASPLALVSDLDSGVLTAKQGSETTLFVAGAKPRRPFRESLGRRHLAMNLRYVDRANDAARELGLGFLKAAFLDYNDGTEPDSGFLYAQAPGRAPNARLVVMGLRFGFDDLSFKGYDRLDIPQGAHRLEVRFPEKIKGKTFNLLSKGALSSADSKRGVFLASDGAPDEDILVSERDRARLETSGDPIFVYERDTRLLKSALKALGTHHVHVYYHPKVRSAGRGGQHRLWLRSADPGSDEYTKSVVICINHDKENEVLA
jgi:hypothetical protein